MKKILFVCISVLLNLIAFSQEVKLEHFLCDCHIDFYDGMSVGKTDYTVIYYVPIEIYNNNISKLYGEYHYNRAISKDPLVSKLMFELDTITDDTGNPITAKEFCIGMNRVNTTLISETFKYGYIDDWSWSLNSANGINFNITYTNTNKKTIKYIDIYFIVKNPVGDICSLRFDHTNTGHLTCVGPIKQYHSGKYEWDAVYYTTGDASNLYFKKFVITYMDNTKYTLVKELAYKDYISME